MSWAAKMEHVPREQVEAWRKAAEADANKRHIDCRPDPEHEDYCLCSYQERVAG